MKKATVVLTKVTTAVITFPVNDQADTTTVRASLLGNPPLAFRARDAEVVDGPKEANWVLTAVEVEEVE